MGAWWRPLLPLARVVAPLIGARRGLLVVEALRAFGGTDGFAGRRAGRMFDKHAHRHAMVGHDGGAKKRPRERGRLDTLGRSL